MTTRDVPEPLPLDMPSGDGRTARTTARQPQAAPSPDTGATAEEVPAPTPAQTRAHSAFVGLLDQPLTRYIPGSSPRSTVALLAKDLGITTVGQLLDHAPRRYIHRGRIQALTDLVAGERTSFVARVESSSTRRMRSDPRRSLTDVVVADDSGAQLKITFFNAYSAQKDLPVGSLALFTGKPEFYRGELSMTGADYAPVETPEAVSGASSETGELMPIPVYPEAGKLTTPRIGKVVQQLLLTADLDSLEDPLSPQPGRRGAAAPGPGLPGPAPPRDGRGVRAGPPSVPLPGSIRPADRARPPAGGARVPPGGSAPAAQRWTPRPVRRGPAVRADPWTARGGGADLGRARGHRAHEPAAAG